MNKTHETATLIFACSNLAVNTAKVSNKRLSKYEEALQ